MQKLLNGVWVRAALVAVAVAFAGKIAAAASPGCGDGCCSTCCEGNDPLCGKLLSYIKSSDPCFGDWISPISNPVFFEDPRTLTEARAVFLHHEVPQAAGGGDIQLYALQLRFALSERLSIIATKDGYAVSSNPLIRDGWGDVGGGLKYNLIRDTCNETLLSAGLTYEAPVGSRRTMQGNGAGEFNFFLSGGKEIADNWHWISAGGFRVAANANTESSSFYWSNHIDRRFGNWYALAEFNWFHWLESGQGGIPGVEGLDLFNFGSTGVAGNDIVTGAFGLKYKPNRDYEVGAAWEIPLTAREDVIESRLNFNIIRRF